MSDKDKDCSDCYDDGYRDGYENAYEEQESNLDDLRERIALLEAVAEAAERKERYRENPKDRSGASW